MVITASTANGEFVERKYVSGKSVPEHGVGTMAAVPDHNNSPRGEIQHQIPEYATNDSDLDAAAMAGVGLTSWIQVPLGDIENPFGHLSLRSFSENRYNQDDLKLLERVSARVAPAFENTRLYAQVSKEIVERTTLADIGRTVSSSSNVAEFFDDFAGLVQKLIPFDSMVYADVDVVSEIVALRYWHGEELPPPEVLVGVSLEGSIAQQAIDANGPILRPARSGKRVSQHSPTVSLNMDEDIEQTLCVPLLTRGEVFGCLYIESQRRIF